VAVIRNDSAAADYGNVDLTGDFGILRHHTASKHKKLLQIGGNIIRPNNPNTEL